MHIFPLTFLLRPPFLLHRGQVMMVLSRAALDMLKKSVRQGGNRKLGGGKDVEGADAPEQLRKLQLQVIIQTVFPFTDLSGL